MTATSTQQQSNCTNGVNVTALFETIEAVKQNAGLARFQFRATNQWMDGGQNRSRIQGFYGCGSDDTTRTQPFVLNADEPPVLLGNDSAPNPVEYVLHALAACLTTTLAYHAAARGIEIENVDTAIEGDLDLERLPRPLSGRAEGLRESARDDAGQVQSRCGDPQRAGAVLSRLRHRLQLPAGGGHHRQGLMAATERAASSACCTPIARAAEPVPPPERS